MVDKQVNFEITAGDSSFRATMARDQAALSAVGNSAAGVNAALGKLSAGARNSTQTWAAHRSEINAVYAAMGKTPSKEVVAQLDQIERKFNSLASTAQSGNRVAQTALRGLLAESRKAATADAMPVPKEDGGGVMSLIRGRAGAAAAALGVVSVAAAGMMIASRTREQLDYADALDDMAQQAGVAAKDLSTLTYASRLEGIENEALTASLGKLSSRMLDASTGGKESAAVFKALGIAVKDQDGNLRSTTDVLLDMSDRFAAMPDGPEKSAMAMEAFGKAGQGLIPFLNHGREGIEAMREEARKLGMELDDETAAAAGNFNDNLFRLQSATDGVFRRLAVGLLPTLNIVTDAMVENAKEGGALSYVFSGLEAVFRGVVIVGGALWNSMKIVGISVVGPSQAIAAAITGNFSKARQELQETAEQITKTQESYAEFARRVISGEPASSSSAPAGVRPTFTPDVGALGATKAQSRVSQWDGELDQLKVAHERQNAENGTFIQFSLEAERDFWSKKLNTVKMSAEERLAVEKKYLAALTGLNKAAYEAQQADQKRQLDALGKNYEAQLVLAREMAEKTKARFGGDSKEYQQSRQQIEQIERSHQDQLDQLRMLGYASERAAADAALKSEEQDAQLSYQLGAINKEQLLALEMEFLARRHELDRQALEQGLALVDPERDPVAYKQQLEKLLELDRKFALEKKGLQGQLAVEQNNPLANVFGAAGQQFNQVANGILSRAQTLRQGLASIYGGIYQSFMSEMVTKPLAGAAMRYARETALYQAIFGVQTAKQVAASAVVTSTKAAEAAVVVNANAAEAATGAAASQAAIPVIGPGLAVGAAAAMLALVLGMGAIASAAGGYDIPSGVNPLVQAHAKEMILPARYADTIRGLGDMPAILQQVLAARTGGDIYHISAMDGRDVERVLRKNAGAVAGAVKLHKRRNGA